VLKVYFHRIHQSLALFVCVCVCVSVSVCFCWCCCWCFCLFVFNLMRQKWPSLFFARLLIATFRLAEAALMIDSPEPSLAEGRGRHGCFSMSMRLDIDTMAELEPLWSKVRNGTVYTLVSVWTLEMLRSRLTRSAIKAMLHFRSRSYDYIMMCDQLLWETTGSDVTIIALSETERKNKSCNVTIRDKSKFETYIRRSVASLVSHSN